MQNDFIQGIMFGQSNFMDLRPTKEEKRSPYGVLMLNQSPQSTEDENAPESSYKEQDASKAQVVKSNRSYLSGQGPSHHSNVIISLFERGGTKHYVLLWFQCVVSFVIGGSSLPH